MTTETRRHHLQQDTEDNNPFIQIDNDYTGADYTDGDYAQAPATNFASSRSRRACRAVSIPDANSLPDRTRNDEPDQCLRHQSGTARRLLSAVVDWRGSPVPPERDHQHDP